jgi:hypothetical protein
MVQHGLIDQLAASRKSAEEPSSSFPTSLGSTANYNYDPYILYFRQYSGDTHKQHDANPFSQPPQAGKSLKSHSSLETIDIKAELKHYQLANKDFSSTQSNSTNEKAASFEKSVSLLDPNFNKRRW